MAVRIVGDTAICEIAIKDTATGALDNPDTSILIDIYDHDNTLVVDGQAMTPDTTGKYHYNYTTASPGEHTVHYKTTDAARVSSGVDYFTVVPILSRPR